MSFLESGWKSMQTSSLLRRVIGCTKHGVQMIGNERPLGVYLVQSQSLVPSQVRLENAKLAIHPRQAEQVTYRHQTTGCQPLDCLHVTFSRDVFGFIAD